jgi:WD40 repeat protein
MNLFSFMHSLWLELHRRVWDLASGQLKATLEEHNKSVTAVAISPDGNTLVSGSDDNTIK